MRILLCKGQIYGPISGSDETLVTYASQLQRAGHEVSVLLMYLHAEDDQYYQRLLEAGVPVSWIASNLAHTSMGAGRKLAAKILNTFPSFQGFIRKRTLRVVTQLASRYESRCRDFMTHLKPDVIHVMTPDPSAMVMIRAAHRARMPVFYQELGIPYHPPNFKTYYEQFTSVLPLCSEVAALSPALIQHCRERLPTSNRLSVMPIMSDTGPEGHHNYAPFSGRVTFGFAARIEEIKGATVLVEAFGKAVRERDDLCLKIAGDGSLRERIATRAKALKIANRYRYHGVYRHPEECRTFMESLDVFIMPSFTEGTPNSIVEAMACGKPIIASAVGGIPDMVTPDCGILVAPGDTASLASAIVRLAHDADLRHAMGAAARKRYVDFFSPPVVMPLIVETYRRVSQNGNSGELHYEKPVHPWASFALDPVFNFGKH